MRRIAMLVVVLVMCGVASMNGTAEARWGNEKCSLVTHCYAVSEVQTSAKGGAAFIYVENANVPEYPVGAFIDDEMWLTFSAGGWLEIGLTAGYNLTNGGDCCTLHPFIAHAEYMSGHQPVGYEEYTWVTVVANPLVKEKIEDPYLNANWCEYFWNGEAFGAVDCHSKPAWTTYSYELEAGVEASSNNSKPYNAARWEVAKIIQGGEWRAWTGSVFSTLNYNGESVAGVMCIRQNPYSGAAGNGQGGTC